MFNIKSTICLAAVALMLTLVAPVAKAQMAPTGNFVSLRVNNSHIAYGLILSPTKILVPAHVGGGALQSYTILAGAPSITVTTCGTCQLRAVTSFIRHPQYISNGSSGYSNDVAIIHMPALTFNATVFAGTIAPAFNNPVGSQFTQIGYGPGGVNHNRLQTTVSSPWTLATMPGYTYTPGAFVTSTVDTSVSGMISYYSTLQQLQIYTKLPNFKAWIDAN